MTYTFVKCGCSIYFFTKFCKSDISRYGFLEVFKRVFGIRDNESRLYISPFGLKKAPPKFLSIHTFYSIQ